MLHDLQFERFELYISEPLSAVRRLIGTFKRLEDAKEIGDINQIHHPRSYMQIDYIGLYGNGREEKFWVKQHDSGMWIKL